MRWKPSNALNRSDALIPTTKTDNEQNELLVVSRGLAGLRQSSARRSRLNQPLHREDVEVPRFLANETAHAIQSDEYVRA